MAIVWLLLFNCFSDGVPTNLIQPLNKEYSSESACLKDAEKGVLRAPSECYFVCTKGFIKK
jgi:hypothetical protein